MSEVIESIERRQMRRDIPRFREGDRVRVHFQVVEGTRRRTQVYEGVVLRLQGQGSRRTFTVRKISFGVGVERTFPLHSPKVERIEVVARGQVRRAKLYYLRGRVGRRARVRERRDLGPEELMVTGLPEEEVSADGAGEDGALEAEVDESAAAEQADGAVEAPAEEAGQDEQGEEGEPEAAEAAEEEPQAADVPGSEPEAEPVAAETGDTTEAAGDDQEKAT
jgi:large subunit ribosomal protein L19